MEFAHLLRLIFFLARFIVSAVHLEKIEHDPNRTVTCSQGLTNCRVRNEIGLPIPVPSGPVAVSGLKVQPALCCRAGRQCRPCLQLRIQLRIQLQVQEGVEPAEQTAALKVYYTIAAQLTQCRKLEFTVTPAALADPSEAQWLRLVVDSLDVSFGSLVTMRIHSHSQTVTVPSVEDVCSSPLKADVEECDALILSSLWKQLERSEIRLAGEADHFSLKSHAVPSLLPPEINRERDVVMLRLANEDKARPSLAMCLKRGEKGECRNWPVRNQTALIPLHAVSSCLCFQVWWEDGSRLESCPFVNNSELRRKIWDNLSLSVVLSDTNSGSPVLRWNLSAPCRVEAELWPCQMGAGGCWEVDGFRQHLNDTSSEWKEKCNGHWIPGVFKDIDPHLPPCVMVKVEGMDHSLGPWCPNDTSRGRWSLAVLVTVLLCCLAVLAAYLLQGTLQPGWVWKWHKGDRSQAPGVRGQVLLLHSSAADPAHAAQVCQLASWLSTLGFTLSLDLWSRAELCSLGPGPWLHSRLDRLRGQGGTALLVLSRSAWERAEEWGSRGWSGETEGGDVLAAALGRLLAARLQGHATQRFVLVQLASLEPGLAEGRHHLPGLFQGLPLYRLPSETHGLLTELATGAQEGAGAQSWRTGWLRGAARVLAGAPQGQGCRENRQAMLGQDAATAMEDTGENAPLTL